MVQQKVEQNKKGKIFVVSAPSGAGKTTLCTKIVAKFPELAYSVSHTTRLPRAGEKEGVDYFFITVEKFKEMIEQNLLAEWAEVHGNFYGTSLKFIEDKISEGKSLLLDIDVQGAKQFKRAFPEAITIFIMPPSIEVLDQRLKRRATDSEDVIAKRLANAKIELEQRFFYDNIVVNDDLDSAVEKMVNIISF